MHTITFSHREYVRDIYAPLTSLAFSVQNWALNPGIALSFPWLSQIASNFEEYQFIQLIWTFKSTVTDFAATSGQVGQVVMCTQYNPDQDAFADKEEMMLYEGGMSCKTTESLIHGVECDPAKNAGPSGKYVRVGSLGSTEDLKDYDHGRTSLAILNCPHTYAGQQIGELWVSYTVHLRKPKFMAGNGYTIPRDLFTMQSVNVNNPSGYINYPMDPNKLLKASKNSLGCECKMYQSQTFAPTGEHTDDLYILEKTENSSTTRIILAQLTFPASFSGVVSTRFILGTTASGTTVPQTRMISHAPLTIARFKDIPTNISNAPWTTWSHFYSSDDNANLPPSDHPTAYNAVDQEYHLRISPSHLGRPNVVYICADALFSQGTYNMPRLEVCLYNSFLSYSDNGSNDQIEMLSNVTNLPVSSPL